MSWKRRMASLSKRVGPPHPPLFAPMVRSVACQIEAISPQDMVIDPVRLIKGISELQRACGIDVLVTATPTAMEAEALGADVDYDQWPPRVVKNAAPDFTTNDDFGSLWLRSAGLTASLEATSRLAPETGDDVVIVAGLTGPATLLAQLTGSADDASEAEREYVTQAIAALVRKFGQAGAGLVVFAESVALSDEWSGMFGTIGNTARFLKMPIAIALGEGNKPNSWPVQALRPDEVIGDGPTVITLDRDPANWDHDALSRTQARIATTAGEIAADFPFGMLIDQLRLMQLPVS